MLAASWPLPGPCWARADACAQILNPILYRADFLPHPNWLAGPAADARFKLSLLAQEGGGAGESKQKDHTFTRKSEYLGWREFVPLAQVGAPTHWPIVLSSMHGRSRLRQREHEGCGWVGVPLRGGAGRQRRAAQGFAGFFAGRQCRGLQAGSAGVCRQAAQGFVWPRSPRSPRSPRMHARGDRAWWLPTERRRPLVPVVQLRDASRGFLAGDRLLVRADITVLTTHR